MKKEETKVTTMVPAVKADTVIAVKVKPQAENKQVVVSEVTTKLLKNIHDDLRETSKRFVRIGVSLYNFKEDRLYKELGYNSFEVFAKAEFNLSKATAYTFINVAAKFTVTTPEGAPSLTLKKEFRQFTSSQLVEMLGLDESTISKVKPTDTIRELRKLKKSVQTSEQVIEDESYKKTGKTKMNEKDSRVPVNRLFIGTAYSFDEISIHKQIIDKFCNEKREKDGKSYRIELNVIWDDLTDGSSSKPNDFSGMNAPENS